MLGPRGQHQDLACTAFVPKPPSTRVLWSSAAAQVATQFRRICSPTSTLGHSSMSQVQCGARRCLFPGPPLVQVRSITLDRHAVSVHVGTQHFAMCTLLHMSPRVQQSLLHLLMVLLLCAGILALPAVTQEAGFVPAAATLTAVCGFSIATGMYPPPPSPPRAQTIPTGTQGLAHHSTQAARWRVPL
jgi:hypothetical protein